MKCIECGKDAEAKRVSGLCNACKERISVVHVRKPEKAEDVMRCPGCGYGMAMACPDAQCSGGKGRTYPIFSFSRSEIQDEFGGMDLTTDEEVPKYVQASIDALTDADVEAIADWIAGDVWDRHLRDGAWNQMISDAIEELKIKVELTPNT